MKTLPKYFAIKYVSNPLWKKYINWLNKEYPNSDIGGRGKGFYYGFGGIPGWDAMMNEDLEDFKNKPTVLTLEEWDSIVNGAKPSKSTNLSYETQYLRSDGILFTKDTIDGKNIEDLKQEMNNHVAEANKIRGLLKAHKNKF